MCHCLIQSNNFLKVCHKQLPTLCFYEYIDLFKRFYKAFLWRCKSESTTLRLYNNNNCDMF